MAFARGHTVQTIEKSYVKSYVCPKWQRHYR